MVTNPKLVNAGKHWTKSQEQSLVHLKLTQNLSFADISLILLRSELSIKLRFCRIVDEVDWSGPTASPPAALDLSDEVAHLILNGSNPRTIARQYPDFYLENGQQIDHLWETAHRRKWRRFQ